MSFLVSSEKGTNGTEAVEASCQNEGILCSDDWLCDSKEARIPGQPLGQQQMSKFIQCSTVCPFPQKSHYLICFRMQNKALQTYFYAFGFRISQDIMGVNYVNNKALFYVGLSMLQSNYEIRTNDIFFNLCTKFIFKQG